MLGEWWSTDARHKVDLTFDFFTIIEVIVKLFLFETSFFYLALVARYRFMWFTENNNMFN